MLNRKGMSLIEVVIAIAILSLGAAVMYSGFTTIAKMMVDSKVYTENVNNQLSALNGKKEDGVTLTTSEEEVKLTIRYVDKVDDIIVVNSALTVATSEGDTVNTLNLKKLKFDEVEEKSDIDEYLDSITGFLNKIGVMSDAERIAHFKELEKDSGYSFSANYQFDNDNLLLAHYLTNHKEGYPAIDQSIIDKCNRIYDSMHSGATSWPEKNARLGDKTYYMHTYFADAKNLRNVVRDGKATTKELQNFLLTFIDTTPGYYKSGWKSSLFYYPLNKSWYYKIFPAGNGADGSTVVFDTFFNEGVLVDFYNTKIVNKSEFAKIN